jgi:hypothetical protein
MEGYQQTPVQVTYGLEQEMLGIWENVQLATLWTGTTGTKSAGHGRGIDVQRS